MHGSGSSGGKFAGAVVSCAASTASAALIIVSFPRLDLFWFAWIALVPLTLVAWRARRSRAAFGYGFLTGFLASAGVLYWIFPMIRYNTGSNIQAAVSLGVLAAYLGLYYGIWTAAVHFVKERAAGISTIVFGAAFWITLEYLKTYLLTGFPWMLLGYSQTSFLPVVQIAELTGVYGVSFLIVLTAMLAARSWEERRPVYVASAIVIVAVVAVAGIARVGSFPEEGPRKVSAAIIQGSIDQYKKWDEAYQGEILATFSTLVRAASRDNPSIIVWPETAVPGFLPDDRPLLEWISNLVRESGTFNLVGVPFHDGKGNYYNAVFLFDPAGNVAGIHRKNHLIPFGEYVPLRPVFAPFFGILNTLGDFEPAREVTVLSTDRAAFGTAICSENFFGSLVRRFVEKGAGILVSQTNDAWFFKTAAADQHFVMNVFRAVENRRPAVVCGNTGVSGLIAETGRVEKRTGLFERTFITVRARPGSVPTFYTRYGDLFAGLCVTWSAAVLIWLFMKNKSRRNRHG